MGVLRGALGALQHGGALVADVLGGVVLALGLGERLLGGLERVVGLVAQPLLTLRGPGRRASSGSTGGLDQRELGALGRGLAA